MGRGVLRPGLAATRFQLTRRPPSAPLAPFVDFYWILRWDLRGRAAHEQTILPHPSVNLAFEAGGAGIYGVDRRLFTRSLSGSGRVLGVRFRAGCFRPFWRAPISELTNRVVPAVRVFGPEAEETRRAIMRAAAAGDGVAETSADTSADASASTLAGALAFDHADAVMTEQAEALLLSVRPERDPAAEQAAALVARITGDPALRRVDGLAAASGMSARGLQRLFADYVGVSPKWVMRRARLHEAAERADGGEVVDWAGLAADLGYADQAHLTRDFTATIGIPPTHYAAPAGQPEPPEPPEPPGPLPRAEPPGPLRRAEPLESPGPLPRAELPGSLPRAELPGSLPRAGPAG
jgi:AraC-like DNA-binding protein